jgi:hypothetical protein
MNQIFRFHDLAEGHRVKVKGKLAEARNFAALQIGLKSPDNRASIEGEIQQIDRQKYTLRVLNHQIGVPDDVLVKDAEHNRIAFQNLRIGDVVKIKGLYTAAEGLVPMKIKVQETMGFHIDELQGPIDQIDYGKGALRLIGFNVLLNERTTIEGL